MLLTCLRAASLLGKSVSLLCHLFSIIVQATTCVSGLYAKVVLYKA